MAKYALRPMKSSDLQLVLTWRNHPDVSKWMCTTHSISLTEHYEWYENVNNNPEIYLMIYEREGKAEGFLSISRTRFSKVADWGFYLAPCAPKGSGQNLGSVAINFVFNTLGFYKVCGQVLAFNERSITFHRELGFTEEGRLRKQHFDGKQYHDVVCFGLLVNDYKIWSKRFC